MGLKDEDEKPRNEFAFLGRGITRTLIRDTKMVLAGGVAGALLCALIAYFMGISVQTGLKFGALLGAFFGIAVGARSRALFDYGETPNKRSGS